MTLQRLPHSVKLPTFWSWNYFTKIHVWNLSTYLLLIFTENHTSAAKHWLSLRWLCTAGSLLANITQLVTHRTPGFNKIFTWNNHCTVLRVHNLDCCLACCRTRGWLDQWEAGHSLQPIRRGKPISCSGDSISQIMKRRVKDVKSALYCHVYTLILMLGFLNTFIHTGWIYNGVTAN